MLANPGLLALELGDIPRERVVVLDEVQRFVKYVKVDPHFDNVRSEPRFQALLARLKIPD